MIIRAKTFRQWVMANLDRDQLREINEHGADCGWPGITYTSDCVKLFDRFGDEIWDMLYDEAQEMGESIPAMIAQFNRVDMTQTLDQFKNLMVWFAVERIARGYDR